MGRRPEPGVMVGAIFNANWLFATTAPKLSKVKRAPDRPHSKFRHVHPIVRIDLPFDQIYPTNTLAIIKVLTSQADAEVEVSRLNQLNTGKGSVYLYCTSRLIEPGGASPVLTSTTDIEFLRTLEDWLSSESEVLILIRYSRAAGSKSFEFFTAFARLGERLAGLKTETCVTAFRKAQLPLRGFVDEEFIAKCLSFIPADSEFLVLETVPRAAGKQSWFHHEAGETHDELRQALEGLRGKPVAVGQYPPWLEDSPDLISGYVPNRDGIVRLGVY
jgi:hypothetical protein